MAKTNETLRRPVSKQDFDQNLNKILILVCNKQSKHSDKTGVLKLLYYDFGINRK